MSFAVFEVKEKPSRLAIEKELLSTVTACIECKPSKDWLGLKHQNQTIRQGLWNIQGLDKEILSEEKMTTLIKQYT